MQPALSPAARKLRRAPNRCPNRLLNIPAWLTMIDLDAPGISIFCRRRCGIMFEQGGWLKLNSR
jgi:hypothetical protein